MMPDPGVPPDHFAPAHPVILRRPRPATVTLARNLMVLGGLASLASGVIILVSVGVVLSDFQRAAVSSTSATPAQLESIESVVQSVLVGDGVVAVLLGVSMAVLSVGVGRGNRAARAAALVAVAVSLCFALASSADTTLGSQANWTRSVDGASAQLTAEVGRAYANAVPGLMVGATGGFTDLQSLGYLAVTVLLLVPASRRYFRPRSSPPTPTPPS
jgi:hypothetical protein